MSNWLAQAIDRGEPKQDALADKRAESLAALKQRQWPNRKTEDWRYLSMRPLEQLQPASANDAFTPEPIAELATLDCVFVNGQLVSLFGDQIEGLSVASLADVSRDQLSALLASFNQAKPQKHLFGLANDVLAENGVFIQVAPGAHIEKPIRLLHWQNGGEAHTRHLVCLGEGASATVIEQHQGDTASFNTSYSEYLLADNAALTHYRFALQTHSAIAIGGCHFNLANHSQLNLTLLGFGSDLSRLDVDINHRGEHANALQNAVYLLAGNEVFDLHSNVEHIKPNGTTEQNVRGIVGDKAKAVFNGRIHIHRYAQKTLAELNNRNLLLTRTAEINTKPELEIYADDVRCAHGATIAELDEKALYYLRSRGVPECEARIMLNFGFINELIDQMPHEPLAQWLRDLLKARFNSLRANLAEA